MGHWIGGPELRIEDRFEAPMSDYLECQAGISGILYTLKLVLVESLSNWAGMSSVAEQMDGISLLEAS